MRRLERKALAREGSRGLPNAFDAPPTLLITPALPADVMFIAGSEIGGPVQGIDRGHFHSHSKVR
jgi:hypothetical protein